MDTEQYGTATTEDSRRAPARALAAVPVSGAEDDRVEDGSLAPRRLAAADLASLTVGANGTVEEPEFDMHLYQTSLRVGHRVNARVKIVNLADRALLDTLPVVLRRRVAELFFSDTGRPPTRIDPMGNMDRGTKRNREVANAYACAGFIDPHLVMTQDEVRDPERDLWVEAVSLHDRLEYVRICEGDEGLAARRLDAFLAE